MNFLELAKKRYSVRKYEPDQVAPEKLLKVLEAGRVAPTAANKQPVRLLVVKESEGLEKLKKGAKIYGAPVAIIACGARDSVWVRPFDKKNTLEIDVSIVTAHMMLQAAELGLGTLWVCYFDPVIIRKEFNIPDTLEPINILAVGHAAGEAASPDRHDQARLPLKDIVSYESF